MTVPVNDELVLGSLEAFVLLGEVWLRLCRSKELGDVLLVFGWGLGAQVGEVELCDDCGPMVDGVFDAGHRLGEIDSRGVCHLNRLGELHILWQGLSCHGHTLHILEVSEFALLLGHLGH